MNLDPEHQAVSCLDRDTVSDSGRKVVKRLKCSDCSKFTASIREQRNFSDRWIFSTDSVLTNNIQSTNVEDELFLVLRCNIYGVEKIHTHMSYFAVDKDTPAVCLFECLRNGLGWLGIEVIDTGKCKKLVAIGTDGAAVGLSTLNLG